MIAAKLAALAPNRVSSLTMISAVKGGWKGVPLNYKAMKYGLRCWMAKTPQERASGDLKLHFTKSSLKTWVRTCKYCYAVTSLAGNISQTVHNQLQIIKWL